MSFYVLQYTNKAVIAISKDIWLLQLYIVQRNLNENNCKIKKKKKIKDYVIYNDNYLKYYFGYAITRKEYEYVTRMGLEQQSDIDMQINDLEIILSLYKNKLKKKELKILKDSMKILKSIDVFNDKKIISTHIDTILNRNSLVDEYFYNLEKFKNCMEND